MAGLKPIGVLGTGYLGKTLLDLFPWPNTSWFTFLPGNAPSKLLGHYTPIPFNWDDPDTWDQLPDSPTDLVLSIPPIRKTVKDETTRVEFWCKWIAQNRQNIRRLIYISTTGVYPNQSGNWNENSEFTPDTEKGYVRWQTEQTLSHYFNTIVIRPGAIYGPLRNITTRIARGLPIPLSNQPVHRIHVFDLAGIVHQVLSEPSPPSIINAVDDDPAPTITVARWVSEINAEKKTLPPIQTRNSYQSRGYRPVVLNRFILNETLKNQLGYALRFPTYKEGLLSFLTE